MEDYNSIHKGPDIDDAVSAALPNGRLDQAIQAAINTAVSRAVAQLAAQIHASQHAADGSDPITPAAINALALDGSSTMNGNFVMSKAGSPQVKLVNETTSRILYLLNSESTGAMYLYNQLDSNNYNILRVNPETEALKDALKLVNRVGGVMNSYNILHEGNIADYLGSASGHVVSGTYDGTGSGYVSLTAPFVPQALLVYVIDSGASGASYFSRFGFFVRNENGRSFCAGTGTYGLESEELPTSWVDERVSWELDGGAVDALDHSTTTYGYIFWG